MSVAFLFPGQGSQKVGMGRALAEAFPESRAVFEEADATLGFALKRMCFDGPESELQLTANTQPAILATSIAAYRVVASRGLKASWVAGHSLGEYSALVAAGSLTFGEAAVVVRHRGEYMQAAVPVGEGAMAAVLALELKAVEEACSRAAEGQVVAPANINGPGQIVIAGHTAAVERAMELCRQAGARRVVRLAVSAPFHCSLMAPAQELLEPELDALVLRDPEMRLVRNVDAQPASTAEQCRDGLVRQISAPVRWQESVERLVAEGVDTFVELGPGTVLSGLVRKIAKDVRVLNAEDPQSLEKAVAALEATGAKA